MSVNAAQVAFRPFSRYISIGARARTRSRTHCCQQSTSLLVNNQVRWRSAPAFRVEELEEENEVIETPVWDSKAPFDNAPVETAPSTLDSATSGHKEDVKIVSSVADVPQDTRGTPTTAQYYSVDGVSIEDLQPDTPARKAAVLAIQALRSESSLAEHLTPAHLEIIFSQLYGEDAFLGSRNEDTKGRKGDVTSAPKRQSRRKSLRYSLALLSQLQTMRRPRTPKIYHTLLRHCVHLGKPDMAASVYAGLVEEWILEGRVAEVGDTSIFGEGGLPKGDRPAVQTTTTAQDQEHASDNRKIKAIIDGWFEGVRTWRLPGESLAPMEKLKLWHPKTLRLQEKMKNFPLPSPTSPPTLVPPPSGEMLDIVICSLTYQPAITYIREKSSGRTRNPVLASQNRPYRRSARALAILGNTILSRTLPVTALKSLFQAMRKLSLEVPVYPTSMEWTRVPQAQRSEFTAGTHIHAALMSLLWSPPSLNFPHGRWSTYRLPPLNLTSTRVLLHYALKALPTGATFRRFLNHIKSAFGIGLISREMAVTPGSGATGHWADFFRVNKIDQQLKVMERDAEIFDVPEPPVTDEDIVFKLRLLQNGAKLDVETTVYKAFPFLDVFNYSALPADADYATLHREQHRRTRLAEMARRRSPWTFVACLNALQQVRSTPLAERLYLLALRAEKHSDKSSPIQGMPLEASSETSRWYLPIEGHTAMLQLYAQEHREDRSTTRQSAKQQTFRGLDYAQDIGVQPAKSYANPGDAAWRSATAILRHVLQSTTTLKMDNQALRRRKQQITAFEWSISGPPLPDALLMSIATRMTVVEAEAFRSNPSSLQALGRITRMMNRIHKATYDYEIRLSQSSWNELLSVRRSKKKSKVPS